MAPSLSMWRFIIPVIVIVVVFVGLWIEHEQASFVGRPPLFTQLKVLLAPAMPWSTRAVATTTSEDPPRTLTLRLPLGFARLVGRQPPLPGLVHVSTGYGRWRKESILGGGIDFHTLEVDVLVRTDDVRTDDDLDLLKHRMFSSTAYMGINGGPPDDVEERVDGVVIQRWYTDGRSGTGNVVVVVDSARRLRVEVTDPQRRFAFAFVEALAIGVLDGVSVPTKT